MNRSEQVASRLASGLTELPKSKVPALCLYGLGNKTGQGEYTKNIWINLWYENICAVPK